MSLVVLCALFYLVVESSWSVAFVGSRRRDGRDEN